MIVDCHGERDLRLILTDNVLVKRGLDIHGLGKSGEGKLLALAFDLGIFKYQIGASLNAEIADINARRGGNQTVNLIFISSAEGAITKHSALRISIV